MARPMVPASQPNDMLVSAARANNLKGVNAAIEKGADVHHEGDHALRWAADNGCLKMVKFLVEQGAEVHAQDDFALRWATKYSRLEVVKFLKSKQ